jgi:hypothetical protein
VTAVKIVTGGYRRPTVELEGATLLALHRVSDDEVYLTTDRGIFRFYHDQDCCEIVRLEDLLVVGTDPRGSRIVLAEERTEDRSDSDGSETWTFYEIKTLRGDISMRWYGASNGYYSETVDIEIVDALPETAVEVTP